jgi:hypothetical protein
MSVLPRFFLIASKSFYTKHKNPQKYKTDLSRVFEKYKIFLYIFITFSGVSQKHHKKYLWRWRCPCTRVAHGLLRLHPPVLPVLLCDCMGRARLD